MRASNIMAGVISVRSREAVKKAVRILKRGGVIIFPTETAYGLGADATNRKAVGRVFEIKQMQPAKKISSMVSDKGMVHRFFGKDRQVDALIDALLPGPLTIITKDRSFRIPAYKFCRELAKALRRPITATSANLVGQPDNYSINHILKCLKGVDLIVDGGRLPKRKTSTVYDLDKDIVYRKGPIGIRRVRAVLARLHK